MSKFSPSGISNASGVPVSVEINGAVNPVITNISMALAGTEYTVTLPSNTTKFMFKLRNTADVQLAYSAGTTGTIYISIPRFTFYSESDLTPAGVIDLFFQAN